ncbi:SubName: Full=Related to major facilitator (MFS1) transporter {ECO:0000313/EMBL:CCA74331.1} [Serendipita indica DSM 11827]|nr:SubName: Full=Related to major facilitator (MFS1) transporter {ECO:0000313/EMBL:CCA74331.1} [Serendipita indica DSM 11827]
MVTTFFVPLQMGGAIRPWSDKLIISLFVASVVLLVVFLVWEYLRWTKAPLPLNILYNRTQSFSGLYRFFLQGTNISAIYHTPFYYQSKGCTPSQSGVDMILYVVSMIIGNMGPAVVTERVGRYWHFMVAAPIFAVIGFGVLFTINEHTPVPRVIGFQILLGFGIDIGFQMPLIAVQAERANQPDLIPVANLIQVFWQS